MSTTITPRDLTKQAPHSPRVRFGGFVILARAVDKCLASIAGKTGDYHFDCPLDNVLFGFKGIKADDFKAVVQKSKTYEEVAAWVLANGTRKTAEEIKTWSDKVEASSIYNDPEKRDYFIGACKELGLDPAKSTTFDWLDADDKFSFKKQAQPA